jgi:hypothetical protein
VVCADRDGGAAEDHVHERRIMSMNKVSSPSIVVVSTLIVVFAASVVLYLAMSEERNPHTAPSASSPAQSTGAGVR